MSKKTWIIFITACVLLIAGVAIFNKGARVDVSNVDADKLLTTGTRADHIYGNKDAKVVLIEYGDYQCPGCGAAFSKLQTLSKTYPSQMAFVFRNLPLTSIHPNALAAATAAEAASKQGKFWEMHDLLYGNRDDWINATVDQRDSIFEGFARNLGLNITQFKNDQQDSSVSDKINYDRALATKQNYTSTPTLVLNGKIVDDDTMTDTLQGNGDKLKALIEDAIKQSGATPAPAVQSSGGNQ